MFVDYQNVYHGARDAFGRQDSRGKCVEVPMFGHVRPVGLGSVISGLGKDVDPNRKLDRVVVFRGEPTLKSHPTLQGAFQRQVAQWAKLAPTLEVVTRPLRYNPISWDAASGRPNGWDNGEEKGIDVLLALAMVLGAVRNEYDVAVLVSGDTDLIPAIDEVLNCGKRVENAVWWPESGWGHRLRPSSGRAIWCHRLSRAHFDAVADGTDYSLPVPTL